jgi:hypothetical protein
VLANRMRGTLDTWDPLFLDELARERMLSAKYVRAFLASAGE